MPMFFGQTAELTDLEREPGIVSGVRSSELAVLADVADLLECLLLPLPGV